MVAKSPCRFFFSTELHEEMSIAGNDEVALAGDGIKIPMSTEGYLRK